MRFLIGFGLLCAIPFASASVISISGTKFPNSSFEGRDPVHTFALTSKNEERLPGYTELLPFILRSPDQDDAGSCLYMSLTGAAEFWLARLHPELARDPDGPIDLSERYLMNTSKDPSGENQLQDWMTDSIFLLNNAGSKAPLNRDYRFAKGWYKEDNDGNFVPARPRERGSHFGVTYNWVDEREHLDDLQHIALAALPPRYFVRRQKRRSVEYRGHA